MGQRQGEEGVTAEGQTGQWHSGRKNLRGSISSITFSRNKRQVQLKVRLIVAGISFIPHLSSPKHNNFDVPRIQWQLILGQFSGRNQSHTKFMLNLLCKFLVESIAVDNQWHDSTNIEGIIAFVKWLHTYLQSAINILDIYLHRNPYLYP